jgi:hypothetical protein
MCILTARDRRSLWLAMLQSGVPQVGFDQRT